MKQRRTTGGWLCTVAVLLATASVASEAPAWRAEEPPAKKVALDEVLVVGTRVDQIRRQIAEAEDRFYALYDALNTDHDLDVHCTVEAPLGTRFTRHTCEPVYQARVEEDEGRALVEGHGVIPSSLVALARKDDYRRNMLAILRKNPQLVELLRKRVELEKQYKQALRAPSP